VDHLSGQNSYIKGARGGPPNLILIGILLFLLLRNPCKNLKSYDNPFWGKSNGTKKKKKKKKREKKRRKIPKIVVTTFAAANRLHSDCSDQFNSYQPPAAYRSYGG
jgi:hypothetical protein